MIERQESRASGQGAWIPSPLLALTASERDLGKLSYLSRLSVSSVSLACRRHIIFTPHWAIRVAEFSCVAFLEWFIFEAGPVVPGVCLPACSRGMPVWISSAPGRARGHCSPGSQRLRLAHTTAALTPRLPFQRQCSGTVVVSGDELPRSHSAQAGSRIRPRSQRFQDVLRLRHWPPQTAFLRGTSPIQPVCIFSKGSSFKGHRLRAHTF